MDKNSLVTKIEAPSRENVLILNKIKGCKIQVTYEARCLIS